MLIKNIALNLFAQGYLLLVSFFTTPFILSKLGESSYGIWVLIITLVNQLTVFDFGLSAALTQKTALWRKNLFQKQDYLKTGLISYLFLASGCSVTLFLFTPFLTERIFHLSAENIPLFRLTALNIGLYLLTLYSQALFQGWERFDYYNLKTFILGSANTLGVSLLLFFNQGLFQALLLITFSLLLTLLISFFLLFFSLKINPFQGSFSFLIIKELINFSFFKFSSNLTDQINIHLPKFFLASLTGVESLPLFTIPLSLVQKTGIILSQISLSLFPNIAYLKGKGKIRKIKTIFLKGELIIFLLMLPFLGVGLIWGEKFLGWWLRNPLFAAKAAPILRILIVAYFLRSFSAIPVAILEGVGNTKLPALFGFFKMILTLLIAPLLISQKGALGAAWLTLGLTCLILPSFLFASWRFLKKLNPSL